MSRLSYIGALVCSALVAAPLTAQNGSRVQQVVVRGSGDSMEVEIRTSGAPVSADTQALTGPDRIVVDFPGLLPSAELHALKVNRGVLRGVRSGLFFNNPPITRIVLDLAGPQSYRISTSTNAVVVRLGAPNDARNQVAATPTVGGVRLQDASLSSSQGVPATRLSPATISSGIAPSIAPIRVAAPTANVPSANLQLAPPAVAVPQEPVKPAVTVTYAEGMLRIHSEKATLAQVLFEVHRQTQAEIAIPAGAEQEQVIADLGPAPARDVLGALLNGSSYNFVFVGDELALERVILTRRDASNF